LSLLLVSALAFCGCATSRDPDMADVLRDLELALGEAEAVASEREPARPSISVASVRPARRTADVEPEMLVVADNPGDTEITIQPDSLVRVSVEEDPGLDGTYPVNEIGAIQFGYIGPVILYNKTEREAERKIREILEARDFRTASVSVRIQRASYDRIRVTGLVNNPGVIKIGAGDSVSLNDALLRSGGLKTSALGARVRIIRGGLRSAIALSMPGEDYALATEDGVPMIPRIALRNDDVVHVFQAGAEGAGEVGGEKTILVLGEVGRPGMYRFGSGEPCTIMHLLLKIGGLPPYAKGKAIRVLRRNDDGYEDEFVVNAREILKEGDPDLDFGLQNGDRVVVPARRLQLF